jgi:hypothetical protein
MNREELRNRVIEKIKTDPHGFSKFLQSSASYWDRDNLGIIGLKEFLSFLYFEPKFVLEKKFEVCNFISQSFDKNTFFILGYPGCGKTTFVHALLDTCEKDNLLEQNLMIYCDEVATTNESKPLIISFTEQIMRYLKKQKQRALINFIDFYNRNSDVFDNGFANAKNLFDLQNHIRAEFIDTNRRCIDIHADRMYFRTEILESLNFRDLFYFFCFLVMSNNYDGTASDKPSVLVIDNIDYFDSFDDLNSFMSAINNFTLDMNRSMRDMCLYRCSDKQYRYVDKFKLIVTMREMTKANIQIEHWADRYRQAYTYYDISEWYDKDKIIEHRLDFLNADNISELKGIIKFMRTIIKAIALDREDEKRPRKDIIFPLFNNDYRVAVSTLARIIVRNMGCLSEYESIMKLPEPSLRYGARGMLIKWICDELILEEGSKENYFKKIGAIDFQNRKNNEVSTSRLVLAYLSNKTDTKCDDMTNCISYASIIKYFKKTGLTEDKIKKSIYEMYDLRRARSWRHLVSFSQLERRDKSRPLDKNIDYEKTTLHYSCAGKIYLEYLSSHFEFFSVRTFTDEDKCAALFCKLNREKDRTTGKYKFIHIIEKVFNEAEKCCTSLKSFNERICTKQQWGNPYESQDALRNYLRSDFVGIIKRGDDKKPQKFFHGERFLNTHIGYIDKFRYFLLNYCTDIPNEEKCEINKQLVDFVEKYVNLLSNALIDANGTIKSELLPHYKKQIKAIKDRDYRNYSIEINFNSRV